MTLPPHALRVLHDTYGFSGLRPGQADVVKRLLAGRSALAVFPTGGGKSLCYQLPALLLDGVTLVISPLLALMKDQIDFLRSRGVPAARLDSTQSAEEHHQTWDDLRNGRLRLLYVAPERFQNERFLARIQQLRIVLMAIDEAHCISEWGHNFRPDYLKLAPLARELRAERVLALTATATPSVAVDICRAFGIAAEDHVHTGFHRPNLFLRLTPTPASARDGLLLSRLRTQPRGATVVYVTLQHEAERAADLLVREGFPARAYHAGLDAEVRAEVQEWFMASPDAVVCATIAFGMGIDKADIRYVFHLNLPKALESYAQEIGRAGRDGQPSICEVFAAPDDVVTLENFSYGDTPTDQAVRALVHELLDQGERFDVSRHDLSQRHDVRPLVVATLLTYLEIEGVLASTAPFYETCKVQPHRSSAEVLARFDPERGAFLRRLLARLKKGRTWFTLDLAEAAAALGEPRQRLVAALEHLAQQGDLTVHMAGVRHGYRVLRRPDEVDVLADALAARFRDAEVRDVARLRRVLALAEHPGCVVRELLAYFGEDLGGDCGHCDRCAGQAILPLPPRAARAFDDADRAALAALREEDHPALAAPRQLARFLCGLPSPATGRAKLRKHPAWARFEGVPFADVLAFVA